MKDIKHQTGSSFGRLEWDLRGCKKYQLVKSVRVFSQIKDIKHQTGSSFGRLEHAPGVGLKGGGGGVKNNFLKMVMWHLSERG